MGETIWEKARKAIEAIATDAGYPCWDAQEDIQLLRSALDAGEKAERDHEEYVVRLAGVLTILCGASEPRPDDLGLAPYVAGCPTFAAAWRLRDRADKAEREWEEARAARDMLNELTHDLRAERDGALAREAMLRDALEEAAKSLETLSHSGSREQELLGDLIDVRGYAQSRARTARAALAELEPTKEGDHHGPPLSPGVQVTPAASAPVAGAADTK